MEETIQSPHERNLTEGSDIPPSFAMFNDLFTVESAGASASAARYFVPHGEPEEQVDEGTRIVSRRTSDCPESGKTINPCR